MKKMSIREIEEKQQNSGHLILDGKLSVAYNEAHELFEVVGHNRVTIDITPTFIQAAKSLKSARDGGNKEVKMYKLNNATGRKIPVWINPLYQVADNGSCVTNCYTLPKYYSWVAQWQSRVPYKACVSGSSPLPTTIYNSIAN